MATIIKSLKRILKFLGFEIQRVESTSILFSSKYQAELSFWKNILIDYERWFDGEIPDLYLEPCPSDEIKEHFLNNAFSAILTWLKVHQMTKYLDDLSLSPDIFSGSKILDVGSGPLPSALAFKNAEIYCLDPLFPLYMEAGFPLHIYETRARFVYGFAENMPFENHFFDAVISVNAIDHVDDFFKTASEIIRVLKPNGKIRLHVHYHIKTQTEPLELNDMIVENAFKGIQNFKKINESKIKRGTILDDSDTEVFALWSNF
jgi:ubiquinone/menaquinone biosynthesis C-methylase UbiE